MLTYLLIMYIFNYIGIKEETKVRENNEICMREAKDHNIERKKQKKTLTTRMSKYQNNRMVCTAKRDMSSLCIYRK